MGETASQARIFIDYSGGNKQLKRVKQATPKDDRSTETVNAIGVDDAAGFRRKPGGRGLTLEVYIEQGVPEVDWDLLNDTQEPIAITIQIVGGSRRQWRPVCVSKVDRSHNDGGEHMMTVELVSITSKSTS